MYEHKTFEVLLSEMLAYVKGKCPDLDTRTGSIIYNALASVAMELETAYHEMDMIMDETFLETASKEYLCKHGTLLGVELKEATSAHFVGEFNVDVGIGCRFNLDKFNFTTVEKLSDPTDNNANYRYELVCEEPGGEANTCSGTLSPINYTEGLTHSELVELISHGEDEEDTEEYRYRILQHINSPIESGNKAYYESLLREYDGLGKCYCYSTVNDGNIRIRILVSDINNCPVSDELLIDLQNYFDPPTEPINDSISDPTYPQGRGMGNGVAPIGAIVTVLNVEEIPVTIECSAVLNKGYSTGIGVQEAIDEYFKSIAIDGSSIKYFQLLATILNCESVSDVTKLTVKANVLGNDWIMDTDVIPFTNYIWLPRAMRPILDAENSVWGYENAN
jgi:uncharacterized phage protein gp47/JayE